ncbi:hypothetical protein BUALT_Bualt06G0039000 [Buddleja alternifolia]|uniref:Uncharacterized protein n=1 Tax=Buddleja alternifolia TaxID=168488 RepID=A0AAV6XH37_9LAMI|nr:hypothetical protein BUALT_Bualt06G0039000 [Buddleja alternifolia]
MAAMRSCVVIWRSGVYRSSMELGNWRSSSSLRYLSDGRVLNEEERAQETIYIQTCFLLWAYPFKLLDPLIVVGPVLGLSLWAFLRLEQMLTRAEDSSLLLDDFRQPAHRINGPDLA